MVSALFCGLAVLFYIFSQLSREFLGASKQKISDTQIKCPDISKKVDTHQPFHGVFIGREWLFREVKRNMNKSEHGVLIVAEPGFGKSAFIANIVKGRFQDSNIRKNLLSYHICKYGYDQHEGAVEFVLDLISQLRCQFPSYRSFFSIDTETSMDDMKDKCRHDPLKCAETYIFSPLKNSSLIPMKSIRYILIDGLDECLTPQVQTGSRMTFIKLFKRKYRAFYPRVKIIATTRNNTKIVSFFQTFKRINIHSSDQKQIADLISFAKKSTGCNYSTSRKIVMHANMNTMDIHGCDNYLTRQLPSNLSEMYNLEFDRIYDGNLKAFHRERSILEVMVTIELKALPLTKTLLMKLLKYEKPIFDGYSIVQSLHKFKAFLIRFLEEDRIEFIHHSFNDWINSPETLISEYGIDIQRGHRLWAKYLNETLSTSIMSRRNRNQGVKDNFSVLVAFIIHMNMNMNLGDHILTDSEQQYFHFIDADTYCEDLPGELKCITGIEMFAWKINDFELMDTIISLSLSKNITPAAFYAVESHHTDTFEALLQNGLNMSQKFPLRDLCHICNIQHYFERSTTSSKWNSIRKTTTQNVIFQGSSPNDFEIHSLRPVDTEQLSLLQASIVQGYIEGASAILEINSSTVYDVSDNGWNVFDYSVYVGYIKMLELMMEYHRMQKKFWYLCIATMKQRVDMVVFLSSFGIKDKCVCNYNNVKWINTSHFSIYTDGSHRTLDLNASYSGKYLLKFRHEMTCESILTVAIKSGLNFIVDHLLRIENHCFECKDARGMTSMATAIFHRNEHVIKTLSKQSNLSFIVSSKQYSRRASVINKLFLIPGERPWIEKHTFDGANIAHLVALRPSCQAANLLISYCERSRDQCLYTLQAKDRNGFTPLYYSLCHDEADNEHESVADFEYPRSHRMALLFIRILNDGGVKTEKLLKMFGICGKRAYYHSSLTFLQQKNGICFKRTSQLEAQTLQIYLLPPSSHISYMYIVVKDKRSLFEIKFVHAKGKDVLENYRRSNIDPRYVKVKDF